ncbi:MAG: 30S ribosomal protein S18 [Phycisphaerae bacterium]|nr:30S ribosomal protein S18 [Phycisphaerae bacterium]
MPKPKPKSKPKFKPKKRRFTRFRDRAKCRFCRENVTHIDYKDTQTLQKLTTTRGKMLSRKRSGNCARHQRAAARALKRARFLSLMPFIS